MNASPNTRGTRLVIRNKLVTDAHGFSMVCDITEDRYGKQYTVQKSAWHLEKPELKLLSPEQRIELYPPNV